MTWRFYNLRRARGFLVVVLVLLVYPVLSGWSGGPARMVAVVSGTPRLLPIYAVDTTEKKVAISFDATWGAELTPALLDILDQHELKTTFFLCGYWIEKHPEAVKEIAARGHELGNHSATHPHLNSLDREAIKRELAAVHDRIKELSGQEAFLFRPPYGEYSDKVIEAARELGYYTIQWSVDSLDWQDPGPEAIYARVTRLVHPGAIVLFHNAAVGTPPALGRILGTLKGEGYEIVPISALIYRENYYLDHRGFQKRRSPESP